MQANVDSREINKFASQAHAWWDTQGPFHTLHDINPLRLAFIDRHISITGKTLVDVGCGGGILSEAMAKKGGNVTGIDLAAASLQVAKLHLLESGLKVDYQEITVEALAAAQPASCDVVTCMEMLEHVPDPASVINACATLVKPGGWVFFSTLNRNPKSYLFSIIGAEYLLKILPKGTHDYAKFIRPSELARVARQQGLALKNISGLYYNPITQQYSMNSDSSVNYLMACQKEVA